MRILLVGAGSRNRSSAAQWPRDSWRQCAEQDVSATKWRTQRSAARETPGTFTLPHPISFHDAKHLCLHEITALGDGHRIGL